jgi:hypothetical protein
MVHVDARYDIPRDIEGKRLIQSSGMTSSIGSVDSLKAMVKTLTIPNGQMAPELRYLLC